jgi:chromosome segregation ATPase
MNEGKKQPWSGRISLQTRERLETLRGQMNCDHDDLLAHLLDAMDMKLSTEASLFAPILAGPRREVPKITKQLQASLDAMTSAICLAEQEATQTSVEAQAQVTELSEALQKETNKNSMLAENFAAIKEENRKLSGYSEELALNLKRAQERTESLDALKSSWKAREEEILDKLVNLKSIAAKVQNLETKLTDAVQSKEKTEIHLQSYEKEIHKMDAEINGLKKELHDHSTKYREILEAFSDKTAKNKVLLVENEKLEKFVIKLQDSIKDISAALDTEKNAHRNVEQNLATTKVRLEGLKNSNQQYQEELNIQAKRFEQENLRMDKELEKLHKTIERQSQQIQQLILKLGQKDSIDSTGQ